MQAEQVLANFGSASLLALLGESLRREQADRNMALQRALHDAGAFRVSQKMAGYLAHKVGTWEDAKRVYNLKTEGLAIFACAAGVNNATDPFEMRKMEHELAPTAAHTGDEGV